ncbi:hypothetical protein AJ78_08719 [Emergomyces pasteurianus Ep9510]|uniref:Uncharacterized protein n=1 Tax=Emergomyces pasteurianus Ep9510 TaxID=1447872 RepID=A0A1J9P1U9_9EURO|nr:hypothetical protein AJ78_08719 [Emergomyces pasteurianus Ep9510]
MSWNRNSFSRNSFDRSSFGRRRRQERPPNDMLQNKNSFSETRKKLQLSKLNESKFSVKKRKDILSRELNRNMFKRRPRKGQCTRLEKRIFNKKWKKEVLLSKQSGLQERQRSQYSCNRGKKTGRLCQQPQRRRAPHGPSHSSTSRPSCSVRIRALTAPLTLQALSEQRTLRISLQKLRVEKLLNAPLNRHG